MPHLMSKKGKEKNECWSTDMCLGLKCTVECNQKKRDLSTWFSFLAYIFGEIKLVNLKY